jgi:hypothetical protein
VVVILCLESLDGRNSSMAVFRRTMLPSHSSISQILSNCRSGNGDSMHIGAVGQLPWRSIVQPTDGKERPRLT